jgi:alpha-glucosidase
MEGVPPLASQPIENGRASDVRELHVLRATTTGALRHAARITTWSPVLAGSREPPRPSLVLAHEPRLEALPDSPISPRVEYEADGQCVRARVELDAGTDFYGLGLAAGTLRRNGRALQLWNTDAWCYGEATPALYQSHPFVLALLPDGRAVGLLADCPRRGLVAVASDGVEFAFDEEGFDLHVIEAEHPAEVSRALASMIGTIELPPLWALGYHQCRWSYGTADEVRAIAREFREREIPCDALWLDIDYMDRHRVFTWNREAFPDPAALTSELHAQDFRAVAIVDPGVVADRKDPTCAEGLAGEHFVQAARGKKPARGRVWPGMCHFPDFTRAETRAWWAGRIERFVRDAGLDGIWNDMNEPSVFRVPSKTLAGGARHRGLGGGTHERFHNLYGQLMASASREGLAAARPERRPFVLTRANHLSGARFAATWTGDNQSRWEDLAWAIPMVLNLGLSGQPFSGPDIGGFFGNPSEELFVRWFELGAYLPFCRGHGEKSSCRKEPWAFGPRAEAHVRAALERRMRLLPHLYTLFHEASRTGFPVARPLFFADPADPRLRAIDDAFLLGDALLVAPIVSEGAVRRTVVLPRTPGGWFAFPEGGRRIEDAAIEVSAPLGTTPIFARAGSIVVEGPTRRSSGEPFDRSTWHVFLDRDGVARGSLYEDEGEGRAHERSEFRSSVLNARVEDGRIHLETRTEGRFLPLARKRTVHVHGLRGAALSWTDDAPHVCTRAVPT